MKSNNPVAVITGAARGIGKGCALELARGGFNLLINDRPDAESVQNSRRPSRNALPKA
nr:3-ketoacyl-(acyl-carrier-protein) reductase [Klebsiella pneumoniae]